MSHSFHFSLKYSGQVQNGINHVKGFNRLLIMRVLLNITCTCNLIFCLYSCICHFINHRLRFSVSFFYIPTLAEINTGESWNYKLGMHWTFSFSLKIFLKCVSFLGWVRNNVFKMWLQLKLIIYKHNFHVFLSFYTF